MKRQKAVRVLIVEDQDLTADLFQSFLEDTGRYRVSGVIRNAQMASVYCLKKPVDLILMDCCTELGASGLTAAAMIKQEQPEIKIIIVTGMPEAGYIRRAMEAGVESFWYKEAEQDKLIEICDRTMAGESVYPESTPELQLGLIKSYELTDREIDILREVVRGASNTEISETLQISVATVKQYVNALMSKTGFKSRTELAVRARTLGLVIPE